MAITTLPAKTDRPGKVPKDRSSVSPRLYFSVLTSNVAFQIKPSRSMTHPLQNPKAIGPKRKVKQGEPFDPEDLSRRLQAHLVEQKLRAERRRDARAAKAAQEYHHVPTVAAAQFERTTTPDVMRQISKLGQPAVKAHLETLAIDDLVSNYPTLTLKRSQAMDQAIIDRDFLRTKNQLHWDHVMEEAAEVEAYRDVYRAPQRTFVNEFSHLRLKQEKKKERPMSTGDILSSEDDNNNAAKKAKRRSKVPVLDMTERNNWAQQDDQVEVRARKEREKEKEKEKEKEREKEKEKDTTAVRRKPSSWILLGKRSSPKAEREEKSAILDPGSPPPDSKKASFLARFKRHPS